MAVNGSRGTIECCGCGGSSCRGRGFALSQPPFFSQPFFVHVNTAETKATKDNASGTKVISNVGLGIPSLCDQHRVKGKENCNLEED